MELEFLTAKNNEQTVRINNIFLHSSYNPSREAERFVQNISVDFVPEIIFITEPGLAYILPFLRERFPTAKIGCLKFTNINSNFDFSVSFTSDITLLKKEISKFIPNSKIFQTLFLKWEPSEKIFTKESEVFWNLVKNIIDEEKTLLVTQQFFEKKWLINSCNFITYCQNCASFSEMINCPVVICASGPSLKNNLQIIKNFRDKIFLICLSSAIPVLHRENVIPDLYFSTDGGFWANFHLRKIRKNIPLAVSPESFVNKNILQNQLLLPIIYSDGFSSELQNLSKIKFIEDKRNGTVSGSALEFAIDHTTFPIYLLGLDLSSQKEYQHTQPNELEIKNSTFDNRINSLEKRSFSSSLPNKSLDIYKEWFANQKFRKDIFRVIEKQETHNCLNTIKDMNSLEFEKQLENFKTSNNVEFFKTQRSSKQILQEQKSYLTYLIEESEKDSFLKNIFSLDYIAIKRKPDNQELQEKINKEKKDLILKITKILHD